MNSLLTHNAKRRELLVEQHPALFAKAAHNANTSTKYISGLERRLRRADVWSADKVYTKVTSNPEGQIHGPHVMEAIRRSRRKTVDAYTFLIGEYHGNEGGCGNTRVKTYYRVSIDCLLDCKNVELMVESFPHLDPKSVEHALELRKRLIEYAGDKHSMWTALACITEENDYCMDVNKNELTSQLIMMRAFAFLVQTIVVYLDSAHIYETVFHDLAKRIHFMDPREDAKLRPLKKITEKDKRAAIRNMLTAAIPKVLSYCPRLKSWNLIKAYEEVCHGPILRDIESCIKDAAPNSGVSEASVISQYEKIFTFITELVSVSIHLSIMESHNKPTVQPHIIVVVGDLHRQLISKMLLQILEPLVTGHRVFTSSTTSCLMST
jgi:hypothetical protein